MKVIGIIILLFDCLFTKCQNSAKLEFVNISTCFKTEQLLNNKTIYFTGTDTTFCSAFINDTINERITIISQYKNGMKISAKGYYNNNQLYCDFLFKDNKAEGICRYFYKSGKKLAICYYENNQRVFPFIRYFEDGSLEDIAEFENGKMIYSKKFFKNGKVKEEIITIDSIENAWITRIYFENGNLSREDENNVRNGKIILYYENGIKRKTGQANNGFDFLQIGNWQEWYESGIMSRDYYFHDTIPNQKEGTWKWFDKKGNLIKEEYYKNGEKTGEKGYVPGENKNKIEKHK